MKRLSRQVSRKKKLYEKDNLKSAYEATLSGMSIYRAARLYDVPESTLRDRTMHLVELDCKGGPERIFTYEEEKNFVDHIVYMANIGYSYSVIDIRCIAADYGRALGKTIKAKEELSPDWYYAFIDRWDQLKSVKPRKMGPQRTKKVSKEVLDSYFEEFGNILLKNHLVNSPERIWIIDESSFSTELPPKKECANDTQPKAVMSATSQHVTIIGGINALGNHIPPFYVFPGKKWCCESLLDGAVSGSAGRTSDNGLINRYTFKEYVTGHLAHRLDIGKDEPATLVMYDGNKSQLSLTLATWAKDRNVVLFVLPPNSSHLTSGIEDEVFKPMQTFYDTECMSYVHEYPEASVNTKHIASLTAKPFIKAFSKDNIKSAFKKWGIYPYTAGEIHVPEVRTTPDVPQVKIERIDGSYDSRLLSSHSVLITGGNRGIGLEMVKQFLRLQQPPQYIFACCRCPVKAEELNQIARHNPIVVILKLDLKDQGSIDEAKAVTESHLGGRGLTLLINNAATIGNLSELEDITREEMLEHFEVNSVAPLMIVKTFLPLLRKAAMEKPFDPLSCNRAGVINVSSVLGSIGLNIVIQGYAYRASKAALNMITSNLGYQLKDDGIFCLAVHPGWVKTKLGGPEAPIDTETSVMALLKMLENVTGPENTGKYYDVITGEQLLW